MWVEHNMNTFKDFLVWYNNLDVGPFVKAVKSLYSFYQNIDIDVFKVAVFTPGIARHMLFNTASKSGAYFTIFDEVNRDVYGTIKNNIIGGPSIIFTRHHKAGETYIREESSKICKSIVGFDANALYLWALDKDMPVGTLARRRMFDGFKPHVKDKYLIMYQWMDWLSLAKGVNIIHKLNNGHDKRIGPYLVDGYDTETNTVYEFLGCYFHGHTPCSLVAHTEANAQTMANKLDSTEKRLSFIKKQGYNLVRIWECEFREQCKNCKDLQSFTDSFLPNFYQKHKTAISEARLLQAVRDDDIFGMFEVDIAVPKAWPPVMISKFKLEPTEYFPIILHSTDSI